jgi:hypothetical protein
MCQEEKHEQWELMDRRLCVVCSWLLPVCLCRVARSAVGILDARGKLVGSISVADLRDLAIEDFGKLLQPVGQVQGGRGRVVGCTPQSTRLGRRAWCTL